MASEYCISRGHCGERMWSRPQYHMSGPETPLATTSDVSCPGGEQGEQTLSQTGAPGAARRCAFNARSRRLWRHRVCVVSALPQHGATAHTHTAITEPWCPAQFSACLFYHRVAQTGGDDRRTRYTTTHITSRFSQISARISRHSCRCAVKKHSTDRRAECLSLDTRRAELAERWTRPPQGVHRFAHLVKM